MGNILSFVLDVLSTAIGVALAFGLGYLKDYIQESKEAKGLKLRLTEELKRNYDAIRDIHADYNDLLLLAPLKLHVYHGAVSSLKIGLLSKEPWYDELTKLYEDLETYNRWQELKANKTLDNNFKKHLPEIKGMLLSVEKRLLDGCNIKCENVDKVMSDMGDLVEEFVKNNTGVQENHKENTPGAISSMITKLT